MPITSASSLCDLCDLCGKEGKLTVTAEAAEDAEIWTEFSVFLLAAICRSESKCRLPTPGFRSRLRG